MDSKTEMNNQPTERRSKYIINPQIQRGLFIYMSTISLLVIVAISVLNIWIANKLHGLITLQDNLSPEFLSQILQFEIWLAASYLAIVCIVFATIYVGGMRYSLRIVGPIYHMEKSIDEFIKTGQHQPINLRKDDYFTSLADKLNTALGVKK